MNKTLSRSVKILKYFFEYFWNTFENLDKKNKKIIVAFSLRIKPFKDKPCIGLIQDLVYQIWIKL